MLEPQTESVAREAVGGQPQRLTRALAHDLRASLHGLKMALEMMSKTIPADAADAVRYLGMARQEAAQLDRVVEQLGLWLRLLGGDYKVRPQRTDLRVVLAERVDCVEKLPEAPVLALADRQLLPAALEGLHDFLHAYGIPGENAGMRLDADGRLCLYGPRAMLPVFRAVIDDVVPDLQVAKGPAVWLVGPSLAIAACRHCGGTVWLSGEGDRVELWLEWPRG